jgi:tRNA(Arg) A34 adenosine deaminase TadA
MCEQPTKLCVELPEWINAFTAEYEVSTDPQAQMAFVLAAARSNIELETGGPFAAAVFDAASGELISLAVNLVTTQGLSTLHAEMLAIALAQSRLGTYDLSESGRRLRLVSSTEPCAMCLGAIPWSGLKELHTGARDADARAIGFDEGAKPDDWVGSLNERGITVLTDILREDAADVLKHYQRVAGILYNPGNR